MTEIKTETSAKVEDKTSTQRPPYAVGQQLPYAVGVAVAKSTKTGAGRGVFATKTVDANQVICFYHGYRSDKKTELTRQELEYELAVGPGVHLVGYMVPKEVGGVGQLINDIAMPSYEGFDRSWSTRKQVNFVAGQLIKYAGTAWETNVCTPLFSTPRVVDKHSSAVDMRTLVTVKAGDELFLHYGVAYWAQHHWLTAKDASVELHRAVSAVSGIVKCIVKQHTEAVRLLHKPEDRQLVEFGWFMEEWALLNLGFQLDYWLSVCQLPSLEEVKKTRSDPATAKSCLNFDGLPKAKDEQLKMCVLMFLKRKRLGTPTATA